MVLGRACVFSTIDRAVGYKTVQQGEANINRKLPPQPHPHISFLDTTHRGKISNVLGVYITTPFGGLKLVGCVP